jgi:hypothetical protein
MFKSYESILFRLFIYVLTDETQTSYILGRREMFNKSGQSTLDTFKDILNDINDHCYQAEKNSDMHVG